MMNTLELGTLESGGQRVDKLSFSFSITHMTSLNSHLYLSQSVIIVILQMILAM